MPFKKLIFALCLLCLSLPASAQPFYFRNLQVEDGLSNNTVFCSAKDSDGFIWFGTRDGLNRFDGYNFRIYRNNSVETLVGNNLIHSIFADQGNMLWIGTSNGLYRFDVRTETFTFIKGTKGMAIYDVEVDKERNIWFVDKWVPHQLQRKNKTYVLSQHIYDFSASAMTLDRNQGILMATPDGLLKTYDYRKRNFVSQVVLEVPNKLNSKHISKIYPLNDRELLIGTMSSGLLRFNKVSRELKTLISYNQDHTGIFVRDILELKPHEFWISSESGIYVYNEQTGAILNFRKEYGNPYSLTDNAIYPLIKDNNGGVWAGTYFGGINYYSPQYAAFVKYYPQQNKANSLSGNAVREIKQDRYGMLWIGTEDAGLNKLDPETGRFSHYLPNNAAGGLAYSNIQGLLIDGDRLWIGTFEHGIDILDVRSGKLLKHYDTGQKNCGLHTNFVVNMLKTTEGKIYVATVSGLHLYNPVSDNFDLVSELPETFYNCLLEDDDHSIWVGSVGEGLYHYQPKNHTLTNYRYQSNQSKSISNNVVNSLYLDKQRQLWVATDGGGLCMFQRADQTFKKFCTSDGFPSNYIFRVEQDAEQRYWVSTSKGLVCFEPGKKNLITYTKASGLLTDQFNYNSSITTQNGDIYFGSVRGLIRFNPKNLRLNQQKKKVYLTALEINNEEIRPFEKNSPLEESVSFAQAITLDADQSTFALKFSALDFDYPEQIRYAYKLKGLEKKWTYLASNRTVYFTKLPAGYYTFQVKAAQTDSPFEGPVTELRITVRPPFYASIWAYLLYFTAFGLIAYLLIRNYYRKIKEQNLRKLELLNHEKEKEVYQAKIEFFTNITHEIRTPLTLIKAPLELVKQSDNLAEIKENAQLMEKNTNRLLQLTNQLLDFRKTEIDNFSLNFVKLNITSLCQETAERFEPAARERSLSLSVKLPPEPIMAYADKEALIKILSNMFSNCIKYADTFVHIMLSETEDGENFKISFMNDGENIPHSLRDKIFEPFFRINEKNVSGTGLGLSLAKSLAELHNGSLALKNAGSDMNIFELLIPLHQQNEIVLFEEEDTLSENEEIAENAFQNDAFNVLIVEDHRDIREFICKEIGKNYTCLQAANAREALQILKEKGISLIISDVMMPGMDGFEFCRILKNDLEYSHIPIILLTAKNTLQAKIEGIGSGADAYIEKPFSPEHLAVQVENLLKNRNSLREHYAQSPLAHLKSMAHSKADEKFLEKLNEVILENLDNSQLDVSFLAAQLCMSKPTFYRKIKSISDLSPNELINVTRLKKAAELLAEGSYKIYEIAEIVGYSSQAYFGKNFQKQFGMSPSDYMHRYSVV